MNYVDDSFATAFDSGYGSCSFECDCGIQHYDCNNEDWVEGELESYESDPRAIGHNGSFLVLAIDNQSFVDGCTCGRLLLYQNFIKRDAVNIAKYIRSLREDALQHAESLKL